MWTKDHHERSTLEGWTLVTTFVDRDPHPLYDIVPAGPRFDTEQAASLAVIDAAKRGGAIHQEALRLVMASRVKGKR
jgi:hypothetical protein